MGAAPSAGQASRRTWQATGRRSSGGRRGPQAAATTRATRRPAARAAIGRRRRRHRRQVAGRGRKDPRRPSDEGPSWASGLPRSRMPGRRRHGGHVAAIVRGGPQADADEFGASGCPRDRGEQAEDRGTRHARRREPEEELECGRPVGAEAEVGDHGPVTRKGRRLVAWCRGRTSRRPGRPFASAVPPATPALRPPRPVPRRRLRHGRPAPGHRAAVAPGGRASCSSAHGHAFSGADREASHGRASADTAIALTRRGSASRPTRSSARSST